MRPTVCVEFWGGNYYAYFVQDGLITGGIGRYDTLGEAADMAWKMANDDCLTIKFLNSGKRPVGDNRGEVLHQLTKKK